MVATGGQLFPCTTGWQRDTALLPHGVVRRETVITRPRWVVEGLLFPLPHGVTDGRLSPLPRGWRGHCFPSLRRWGGGGAGRGGQMFHLPRWVAKRHLAVPPFTSYPVSLQARQWALWATCRHSYNRGHKLSRALNRPSSGGTVHCMHVEPMDHIIISLSRRS